MPPSASLRELGTRGFICWYCLGNVRRRLAPKRLGLRRSSQASSITAPGIPSHRKAQGALDEYHNTLRKLGMLEEGGTVREAPVVARYYEQGEDGKLTQLDDAEAFNKSLNDPSGKMARMLKDLEEVIGENAEAVKSFEALSRRGALKKLAAQMRQTWEAEDEEGKGKVAEEGTERNHTEEFRTEERMTGGAEAEEEVAVKGTEPFADRAAVIEMLSDAEKDEGADRIRQKLEASSKQFLSRDEYVGILKQLGAMDELPGFLEEVQARLGQLPDMAETEDDKPEPDVGSNQNVPKEGTGSASNSIDVAVGSNQDVPQQTTWSERNIEDREVDSKQDIAHKTSWSDSNVIDPKVGSKQDVARESTWSESHPNATAESSSQRPRIRIEVDHLLPTRHGRRAISNLNEALQHAAHRDEKWERWHKDWRLNYMWKCYHGAQRYLAGNWSVVPQEAWDILWDTMSVDIPQNKNRMSRLYILSRDMERAGLPLPHDRQILAIEAMFAEGWHQEAIKNHRKLAGTLGANPKTFIDFWKLGLWMHCQVGDIDRAERVANLVLDSTYEKDPRILLPFIHACASKPDMIDKAYQVYQRMRRMLGHRMNINDYDQIISYFLTANQTEHALYIFVDMMTSGSIDLRAAQKLPSQINGFFLGKWLKRLIGAGDYSGAHTVLVYMMGKGVMAYPVQINGLIGAWLRSGKADNVTKAETLAWAMINSRLLFVTHRAQMRNTLDANISLQQSAAGSWPRATLETFQLMAENYKDRGLHSQVIELWGAFRRAELRPDCFMLNQLLFSYLRDGRGSEVTQLCRDLSTEFSILPDPWTFMALWQALPVNRLHRLPPDMFETEVAKARHLFSEMVLYASAFRHDGIDFFLARTVVHTFRKLRDDVGMLIAFRALRLMFKLSDVGQLVIEIMVKHMDLGKASIQPAWRKKIVMANHRIEAYLADRRRVMVKDGRLAKGDELPPEVKAEEMKNLLELHMESEIASLSRVEELFIDAAQKMGVYKADGGKA